ncbi:MAG TPA: zinc-binding dehydrogenase, partial [Herpetosiphonaceae bacterium]
LGFAEAAAISAGATTAYAALFENAGLAAGQRVLIHGGAGGVGAFAVQLARWKGARVIATASAANRAFVSSLGAETVIDYAAEPFEEAAGGVDAVLDTIGGETLLRSMRTVRPGGVVVSLLGQPPQDLAAELGIRAMNNQVAQPFPSRELLQTIAALIESGQIAAHLGPAFALEEAAMAQELVRTGHGRGRVTLRIGPGEG